MNSADYIPLPQQFASFARYFHVVERIPQSQTFEYRFGRYLPVLFAHVHKIFESRLTAIGRSILCHNYFIFNVRRYSFFLGVIL